MFWSIAKILFVNILLSIAFAQSYSSIAARGVSSWLGAAIVNSVLAAIVFVFWLKRKSRVCVDRPQWLAVLSRPMVLFGAGATIVIGSVFLAAVSRLFGGAISQSVSAEQWLWIVWIPLVEELVFRVGVGEFDRSKLGLAWGSYISALTFSFVHSQPTWERILHGQVGLPLGPFLLALSCELMLASSGRIAPIVLFHAACNATPVIFSLIDGRWLRWLSFLYL